VRPSRPIRPRIGQAEQRKDLDRRFNIIKHVPCTLYDSDSCQTAVISVEYCEVLTAEQAAQLLPPYPGMQMHSPAEVDPA